MKLFNMKKLYYIKLFFMESQINHKFLNESNQQIDYNQNHIKKWIVLISMNHDHDKIRAINQN